MPARIIGMIGVSPPQQESSLLVIEGEISPPFIGESARVHELRHGPGRLFILVGRGVPGRHARG
ncbi:MAG TPA: hypothetical protein VFP43_15685, partial [Mesorhizobium sp.]|nr:hypothetical protein [Mesorhizobium sp.]